jgi:hypothetical protein
LQCAGFPPRSPNFRRLRHFQRHRHKLSPSPPHPKASKLLRLQGHQSSEIGPVNSPRSAAKRAYKFELVIGPRGAETTYPDLDCTGTLTRVGTSKSYVFFVEIITKGAVDKGGRCPDGTITVARAGNDLVLFWFGSIEANTIVAYGTLSKK